VTRRRLLENVKTEGSLMPEELLLRILAQDRSLPGMDPEAYHLGKNERLGEAVNRSWTRLVGLWASFCEALAKLPETDQATTLTREKWLLPLFQELGYGRLSKAPSLDIEGRSYPVSHQWSHSPIHLLGCRVDLDTRQKGVQGAASASPHGLVQDLLNRSDAHFWGFVSNGLQLRVLRDHKSLTQQAYVEFDLETIMDGEHYSDFMLLWLTCHQSRVEAEKNEECWLEQWFEKTRSEGIRALDHLRGGVETAIAELGTGFLSHPKNGALHESLSEGKLPAQDFYRELLRLVYRLVFLFVAEDRELLLDPNADPKARDRYLHYYSTHRLRDLSLKTRGTAHGDLWQSLRVVMSLLAEGGPQLGLPALGSYLWRRESLPHLVDAELANEHLLKALRALCTVKDGKKRLVVNWRNIGAEELGSIYESLLELHPNLHRESGRFELDTAAGHERKTTGSYYTPTSLVDCLLDSALDPVLDEAAKKPESEKAILDLKVCDPACGSGHFLVAAARRIAKRLAQVRAGEDEPSPKAVQHALRDVVGHCIFGVDLNPMAVELCKVSLWMEAMEPGRPLSFLDSHIQCGNALLGTTPALMARGIPDEAFEPIEGDDKKIASILKKRNKQERQGQSSLFASFVHEARVGYNEITTKVSNLETADDADIQDIKVKENGWQGLTSSADYQRAKLLADTWCAAFVWPKTTMDEANAAPTQSLWETMKAHPDKAPVFTRATVQQIAQDHAFFHWHLAFPQVFTPSAAPNVGAVTGWEGGFGCVLGNPPWERLKIQEKEWFAEHRPEIVAAPNAAARRKMIVALADTDPTLLAMFQKDLRLAEGEGHLVRSSGRFPLCGKGDVNTFTVFAETNLMLMAERARVGCVIPTGIATDDTTKDFFAHIAGSGRLASLFDFQSGPGLFAEVGHARFKFCLLTLRRDISDREGDPASFAFGLRNTAHIADESRVFALSAADIALLNPNTHTCPVFRYRRDAEITKTIYRHIPVLVKEGPPEENPWGVSFMAMFHMANDSGLFHTQAEMERQGLTLHGNVYGTEGQQFLPLYEAKMVHHFDHRYGDYRDQPAGSENTSLPDVPVERLMDPGFSPSPRYWVDENEVAEVLTERWARGWLLGWRDICRNSDERTVITSVIPRVAVGDKFLLMLPSTSPNQSACLFGNLASFIFDYVARQKVGGSSLKYFTMRQLPVLPPSVFEAEIPWHRGVTASTWIGARVIELTYTAADVAPFAKDCGYDGPPFKWDGARRFLLRRELDAAFFHLYDINRDDVAYVMDTFHIVKGDDEKAHGSYRTNDTIIDIYDRMQRAIDTGIPYETVLDPPPADPKCRHRPQLI